MKRRTGLGGREKREANLHSSVYLGSQRQPSRSDSQLPSRDNCCPLDTDAEVLSGH